MGEKELKGVNFIPANYCTVEKKTIMFTNANFSFVRVKLILISLEYDV